MSIVHRDREHVVINEGCADGRCFGDDGHLGDHWFTPKAAEPAEVRSA